MPRLSDMLVQAGGVPFDEVSLYLRPIRKGLEISSDQELVTLDKLVEEWLLSRMLQPFDHVAPVEAQDKVPSRVFQHVAPRYDVISLGFCTHRSVTIVTFAV